ncbi:uncharacterized protein LOC116805793 [Drosophila grimshawi]|uniref:uncharacterized protein LOC116805793 n=1 Tax=Drosophila grimshawi TaxID=7222 RepID=UPI000C86FC1C|nr:uncharacterized protein LOC116805793 [Drosophila grimshawi]
MATFALMWRIGISLLYPGIYMNCIQDTLGDEYTMLWVKRDRTFVEFALPIIAPIGIFLALL